MAPVLLLCSQEHLRHYWVADVCLQVCNCIIYALALIPETKLMIYVLCAKHCGLYDTVEGSPSIDGTRGKHISLLLACQDRGTKQIL